jgi:hypothetical protein
MFGTWGGGVLELNVDSLEIQGEWQLRGAITNTISKPRPGQDVVPPPGHSAAR